MEFIESVKNRMTESDVSMRQLAHLVGVSPGYLSRIFGGERKASLELAYKIAAELGIPAEAVEREYEIYNYPATKQSEDAASGAIIKIRKLIYTMLRSQNPGRQIAQVVEILAELLERKGELDDKEN